MTGVVAIEATELTKTYDELIALAPLDLRIEQGERVVLVGPNGSGKTTFLRLLAGLLDPTAGSVTVRGEPAGTIDARASLSYVADDPVLYDDLSLGEHLQYLSALHETDDWEARAHALVQTFGLDHRWDDLPVTFSRGMRQKTSLALGLLRPYDVLAVDEPFVGLDPPGRDALVAQLTVVAADRAAVIVATHQLEIVGWADRCLALRDGALIHDGPADPDTVRALVE